MRASASAGGSVKVLRTYVSLSASYRVLIVEIVE